MQVKKSSSSKSSRKSKTYESKDMLYDQFVKVGIEDIKRVTGRSHYYHCHYEAK